MNALDPKLGKIRINPDWAKLPLFDRKGWKRLPFGAFAESVNERVDPGEAADEIYVGLEHLDPQHLHIRRWGKGRDVIGTKLRFRKGDLIFGRRRAYQRKLAVAEFDGICSAHAMVVRAKLEQVLPEFLPYLMMSDHFMKRAVEISVGSLSPTINWKTLKLEAFTLPPIAQQRRVAEVIDASVAVVNRYQEILNRLIELRASFANDAYSLSNSNGRIASNGRLEDLAEINPTLGQRLENDTSISFITMADVSEDGHITQMTVKPYSEVKKGFTAFQEGDLLFAKITPCMENGKGAIAKGLENGIGFGSTEFHILRPKIETDRKFLYHLTMTAEFRAQAKRFMRGSAGQLRVPAGFLKDFGLSIPTIEMRIAIGNEMERLTAQIESVLTLRAHAQNLQMYLIAQLCTD